MARAPIHTIAVEGGWANQRQRSGVIRSIYRTRAEARRAGQELARRDHTEHVVHLPDGKVLSRQTFEEPTPHR